MRLLALLILATAVGSTTAQLSPQPSSVPSSFIGSRIETTGLLPSTSVVVASTSPVIVRPPDILKTRSKRQTPAQPPPTSTVTKGGETTDGSAAKPKSNGALIGGVIGVVLAIPLLAAIVWVLLNPCKRRSGTPALVDVEKADAWKFDNPSRVQFHAVAPAQGFNPYPAVPSGLGAEQTSHTPDHMGTRQQSQMEDRVEVAAPTPGGSVEDQQGSSSTKAVSAEPSGKTGKSDPTGAQLEVVQEARGS